jgi:hypothetical protein
LIGNPIDVKGEEIHAELKRMKVESNCNFELVTEDDVFGQKCKYIKLIFEKQSEADLIFTTPTIRL